MNDRPYVASSFLSVAIARVLGTALSGNSAERPELAAAPMPLEATVAAVRCRGGERVIRSLFEPLGYAIGLDAHPLDATRPEWTEAAVFTLRLEAKVRLSDLLSHLYVLLPVLEGDKHYWVGDAEVQKLVRHGEGWLERHPERELIARRYLRHQKSLARQALEQLVPEETDEGEAAEPVPARDVQEHRLESGLSLDEQRREAVLAELQAEGAKRVVDLGCGEGKLLKALLHQKWATEVVGLDVSMRTLERAKDRLQVDRMPELVRRRLTLLHGSLMYRDARLQGFDAATVVEVVEHLDAPRLQAFERVLFEFAKPTTVVLTTPNVEFNVKFENLPKGQLRHGDHRFEWTRAEFHVWAKRVAERSGYTVRFVSVGEVDPELGPPTQMAVFRR